MKKNESTKRVFGISMNNGAYAVFFAWQRGISLPKSKNGIVWFATAKEANQYLRDNFGPNVVKISV